MKELNKKSNILITGGLGFIGTNLIIKLKNDGFENIFSLDKISYSSSFNYSPLMKNYINKERNFNLDISITDDVRKAIMLSKPEIIFHIAAETHVDRSIESPFNFIQSNIIGTYNMLEESRTYWEKLNYEKKKDFKFIHISTDEVFGDLMNKKSAKEITAYSPSSPYSASKASADHLVKAWNKTYGLPTIVTNCSNNYGPWQFPEKLIPLTISKVINHQKIPIYGDGNNIRNWIFVLDHIDALLKCASSGLVGESYCIGGDFELSNKKLIKEICDQIEKKTTTKNVFEKLAEYVPDRPGHDFRYSIDSNKIKSELKWIPKYSLMEGLEYTINWYLENKTWLENIKTKSNYFGERLGLLN
tara:strand:- start:353 stop:1429 length:1077 start_codon:yes stop_codon:yes gene_type:complete